MFAPLFLSTFASYALFLFANLHFLSHYTALPQQLVMSWYGVSWPTECIMKGSFSGNLKDINPSAPLSSSEPIYRYTTPLLNHYSAPESSTATILSTGMYTFEISNQLPPLQSELFKTKEDAPAYAHNYAQ